MSEAGDWHRAQARAFKRAGYRRVYLDEPKRCPGGREELPAERAAWQDGQGVTWCRGHLATLLDVQDEHSGTFAVTRDTRHPGGIRLTEQD